MSLASPRIVVVGGGLSGLSLAYRLQQRLPAAAITLLEKRPTLGGNISTVARDGFRVECGPNGIFDAKPFTLQLCRDLGLGDRLIPASEASRKHRFLFVDGKLKALPSSLASFLASSVLSWRGKLNVLREKYRKRPVDLPADESIAAFATRRAGAEVARVLADAVVTGVHAGDPELLSVAAAFPRLPQLEREYGSVSRGFSASRRQRRREAESRGEEYHPQRLWSFREGLQALVDGLRDRVKGSIVTGAAAKRVEQFENGWRVRGEGQDYWDADAVLLTSPAHEQAGIVDALDPDLAIEMRAIPYNRIAVVAMGYRESDVPKIDGFGYIAPQNTRRDLLGVQWCSSIFPDRAPPGMVLWRALCGGSSRAEVADWPDERLVEAVRGELRAALSVVAVPAFVHIARWPAAIPQYVVGHLDRVKRIDMQVSAHPGIFLGGNAYQGVAMNDCTEQAELIAARVVGYLGK